MPEISRGRALAYVLAILLVLVVGGRFVLGVGADIGSAPPEATTALSEQRKAELEIEAGEAVPRPLVVHVVGAVERPGLYELAEGSRVDDALERAGGPTKKAALDGVNLAAPVGDGQQIVIPDRRAPTMAAGSAATSSEVAEPVRLNSASLAELESLPGVGPITAQKIVDYREQHGGFTSVDELDAVPGIGLGRLEQLREHVQL